MNGPRLDDVRLAHLVRYPIKGFSGQELDAATLRPGSGLPYDRVLAITNGTVLVDPDGGWTTSRAFVRLLKNTDLPRYGLRLDNAPDDPGESTAGLTAPHGERVQVRLDDPTSLTAADEALARWFGRGPLGPARLVSARQGLWDHPDAALSIINLETLADLAATAGRPVERQRFRANLFISGLPAWEEMSLSGRHIRVGDVELEVLRPTDRCRATAVDPAGGGTDLNVPALLASRYGHQYCGVYARVVTGGRLATGQRVVDVGAAPRATREATKVSTAPPVVEWPRRVTVVQRVQESPSVVSFWLRDPLAALRPEPQPGQHLRLHTTDAAGPLWRAYTISGVDDDLLRVSVKQADSSARMSRLLHSTGEGAELLVSGPLGEPIGGTGAPGDPPAPLLLGSAGIGITPTVATLRALVTHGDPRPVRVLHVARDHSDLALWPEAVTLTSQLADGRAELFLSRGGAQEPSVDVRPGRPRGSDWTRLVESLGGHLTAQLCGPVTFMQDATFALLAAGVEPDRVAVEVFVSPETRAGTAVPPPMPGPFHVSFTASEAEATWYESGGTLLDLADACGLMLPASCRSGACGTCAQRLVTGETAYTTEPVLPPRAPVVLLCCAVPTSDVFIQA